MRPCRRCMAVGHGRTNEAIGLEAWRGGTPLPRTSIRRRRARRLCYSLVSGLRVLRDTTTNLDHGAAGERRRSRTSFVCPGHCRDLPTAETQQRSGPGGAVDRRAPAFASHSSPGDSRARGRLRDLARNQGPCSRRVQVQLQRNEDEDATRAVLPRFRCFSSSSVG